MPLLLADDLHLAFGPRTIFDGATVAVERGDRLGLVGANGSGKSTLLRILAGGFEPDGGQVVRRKGLRVGYLAQEHGEVPDGTLIEQMLARAPGREALQSRIAEVEATLAEARDPEEQIAWSQELSDLVETFSALERDFARHRAERILIGLGFTRTDFDRRVGELSGGWRMRAALAGLLFERPDVMLLDEPTNHLDVPSVHWLSRFLDSVQQAVVLTCHDRSFLNRHVKRIASLELEGLRLFSGNYDDYLEQRELDLVDLQRRIDREEQRRKELEAFVTRFRAKASKARQAQSKAKQIERLEAGRVELPKVRRAMSIRFPSCERGGAEALRLEALTFGYGDRTLFEKVDLLVRSKERVAIVGPNGAGKTTLLKLIARELAPAAGEVRYGSRVQASYFAQHHAETLRGDRTVLDEVWAAAPARSQTEVRGLCGAFLFTGDDVDKSVRVLSGGEKARVALARMLLDPQNLLVLDEPTNHLDTESADKLTESLATYDGTLLFVSHNLDFARRLATVVWEVSPRGVSRYPGSLDDYLGRLAEEEDAVDRDLTPDAPAARAGGDKATRIAARQEKKAQQAAHRRRLGELTRQCEQLEADIAALEEKLTSLQTKLEDPKTHEDRTKSEKLSARYAKVEAELSAKMDAWAEAEAAREAASGAG